MDPQKIGFVSTRFAGTDGVSLESAKWAQVLWDHRHVSYWYSGKSDRDESVSMVVPEAYFGHPEVQEINRLAFGKLRRDRELTRRIYALADHLKQTIYDFVERYSIDVLVVQNALCIPMHLPLGVALTQFIAETGMPTIAHHHDFYWERDRFTVNCVSDILEMAFPPSHPSIQHVTINSFAQQQLAWRTGSSSILIPNVLKFEEPEPALDTFAADFREEIGIGPDDILVLQPTRVVPRKGIEHSINLVAQLKDPRFKLVVTHESGDEGQQYLDSLISLAQSMGVEMIFVDARVGDKRGYHADGSKIYSLEDVYPHADLVTYPSIYEGFGNAFLEAVYFRKPIVVNRYSIFIADIEPKGFQVISMDGFLTENVGKHVKMVVEDEAYRRQMVDHNYELALNFYSYAVLRRKLRAIVCNYAGADDL